MPAWVGEVKLNVIFEVGCGCCGLTVKTLLAAELLEEELLEEPPHPATSAAAAIVATIEAAQARGRRLIR
jgi:hypothetical protein